MEKGLEQRTGREAVRKEAVALPQEGGGGDTGTRQVAEEADHRRI